MQGQPTFRLLGVPVYVRPQVLVPSVLVGLVTLLLTKRDRAQIALGSALLWSLTDIIHTVGHIISARQADAPMDYVEAGFYPMTGYHNHDVTPQQHIGRTVGGVAASGLAALVFALLARLLGENLAGRLARVAAIQNGLIFGGLFIPLDMVDGGIILRNMRKLKG